MPKKGKGKKGKKKPDRKFPGLKDGMTQAELIEQVSLLLQTLDNEQEDRNYTQIERDRLHDFLDITQNDLDDKRRDIANMHAENEEGEEKHRLEIKMYQQKIKYLMHEQRMNLDAVRADAIKTQHQLEQKYKALELDLRKNQRALKEELKAQQLAHEDAVNKLRLLHEEAESKLRADFERQAAEIEAKYNEKLRIQREELDLKRRTELHEVEERKNAQFLELIRNHEKAFRDAKDYYNDITTNNLSLVNTLKETLEEAKRRQLRLTEHTKALAAENRRMKEPLMRAGDDIDVYKRKLKAQSNMRQLFDNTKGILWKTEEELRKVKFEREVLTQQLAHSHKERDDLQNQFIGAVHEVYQKSSFKNLVLERKLEMLQEAIEQKDSEIGELLSTTDLEPSKVGQIFGELEQVLESKNLIIRDLQYEVARVSKAHCDLMNVFKARLAEFGMPVEQAGFVPLDVGVGVYRGNVIGMGPAGLVSEPM